MAKTMAYELLGGEVAAQPNKNLKTFGCVICALAAGGILGTFISSYKASGPAVSEMASTNVMRSRAGLGARYDILRKPAFSSPLAKLAITSIEINERMNAGSGRDVAMKAVQDLGAQWDLVDEPTKEKLMSKLEPIKYKKNYLAGVTAPMGYFDPLGFTTDLSPG